MTRLVVLLRGVNVGKGNRLPMADWRALLTSLGYSQVATLLNSGNAVCEARGRSSTAHHARVIAGALADRFGLQVPVVVKTAAELSAIVAGSPLADVAADPSRLLVVFAQHADALAALAPIAALTVPPERLEISAQAGYLHCANGILDSRAGSALLGKAGQAFTTRNWATTCKLQALACGPGG
jgi:uncharacterized protein (DUF1697 family)